MAICLESFQYIMITSLAISPRTIGKIVLQICGIKMLLPEINNPLCEIVQFKTIGWISEWYKCNAIWIMWTYFFDVLTIIIFLLYLNSIYIMIILKPKNAVRKVLKDNNHSMYIFISEIEDLYLTCFGLI